MVKKQQKSIVKMILVGALFVSVSLWPVKSSAKHHVI